MRSDDRNSGRALGRLAIPATLIAVIISSCSLFQVRPGPEDFISVRGTHFYRNGRQYTFAGANLWYGAYLGSPGVTGDIPRLRRELDALASAGVTNLRVLAASERSSIRGAVTPAIQRAPGLFDDSLLVGLDVLLAEMGRRSMHAVLYLGNYWEWSGGMTQYNTWAGSAPVDPYDSTQGWGAYMDSAAAFYSNPRARALYEAYLRTVVSRTNSVTGVPYAQDPTIMAWQLANEPRPGQPGPGGERNIPAFALWIDETARLLHSLDTNHLVSTGSEGVIGTLKSEAHFVRSHDVRSVDYLVFHLWARNWEWFVPERWEETLPSAEERAAAYIGQHIAIARRLGKPIVMEEFGLDRDDGAILPNTPVHARDRYFRFVYKLLEDSARAGAPIAGSNFWGWGGEAVARHADGLWRAGDPFVADPPQEPQGRNSVFSSDTSTIAIIREHAFAIRRITPPPLRP